MNRNVLKIRILTLIKVQNKNRKEIRNWFKIEMGKAGYFSQIYSSLKRVLNFFLKD